MVSCPIDSTDFRLLLPEVIWLEPEPFEQARKMSAQVKSEAQQWQTYLNTLARLSFEEWLSERIPDKIVSQNSNIFEYACCLKVGEFKICLIATEHLLDEVVNVPQNAIDQLELTAHFYVVVEVLEEEQQVIIRGFLRYDCLVDYLGRVNLQSQDSYYQLPLSLWDTEPNHLLFYCRCLEPTAIPLPIALAKESTMPSLTKALEKKKLKQTRTKLSQWLQGIFDGGWQAIDALISSEANLALSTRNAEFGAKGSKLIDLGMQFGSQTLALVVTITEEVEEKLGILVQLHPTGGERYLPPNLKLTLLSKMGKILQEVQSRCQDNYIQLKSFKGEQGKRFSIEVSFGDASIREDFEL